jgi:hypothetical protein
MALFYRRIMRVTIEKQFEVNANRETAFAFIINPENMTLFKGYGRIPGIAEVIPSNPLKGVGHIDIIKNCDGSSHLEQIIAFAPPKSYALHIHCFQFPVSLILKEIFETWHFQEGENGTTISRKFELRWPANFLASWIGNKILAVQFEKAIELHHQQVKEKLARKT